jgi:glycosyltransferase involved in cell wall biosynthesis
MNVLFLTLVDFSSLSERYIYTDLLREFVKDGHQVCVISPTEKRHGKSTHMIDGHDCRILKLKIGNVQKTNMLEKGISMISLESKFAKGVQQVFHDTKFDLILFSTPPVTLRQAVSFVRNRDGAMTYLLLKDIHPQGAVDLGVLSKTGLKGLAYQHLRKKEKRLYQESDFIGCMSQANVDYLLSHNPEIAAERVEICPNSIEPAYILVDESEQAAIRERYHIPVEKTVFIYAGNLGKPQGVDFLTACLDANKENKDVFFCVIGAGTEHVALRKRFDAEGYGNAQLIDYLPKSECDMLTSACDVGLIFLDKHFTIPNFPSRLLSYMQASLPVLSATDLSTDIGAVIEQGQFGCQCLSGDVEAFCMCVTKLCDARLRKIMSANARQYLEEHYTAKHSYDIIMKHFVQ